MYINTNKARLIIQEWCNEIGKPVSIIEDRNNKTINLYTKWPGWYIGKAGVTFYKYEEQLKALGWEKIKIFELAETFQPGDDYGAIIDERVEAFFETEYID